MGCGTSKGSAGKIKMTKTKLGSIDEFFDDVQGVIDEAYSLRDPIEDARDKLVQETDFEKVVCSNTHHAIVGTVFALSTLGTESDLAKLFDITQDEPYVKIDTKHASGKLLKATDALTDYVKNIIKAKGKIEALVGKSQKMAEKAPEMPDKAKDSLSSASDLGAMDKIRAVKNTASNCKELGKLPTLVKEIQLTVTNAIMELQAAGKELNDNKAKLVSIRKKCLEKKSDSPKICYLACGTEIKNTPELKKEWEAYWKRRNGNKTTTIKKN
jgi:multidrug efflux pump subunit AcrB